MSLATDPLPANPSALRIFAADLQAELARKQAEEDKKKQKEVADAEKKLKAAQAAYDAEVGKTKKEQ